ncbi:unnamed protein product [marine sediment metagenome]|uniref:Uncharacterized protein n=1 Tax=marine sediment metagenome TaxID=412755 RepID=X1D804_9ZZZZ
MNGDWERGYDAGYRAASRTDIRDISTDRGIPSTIQERKASQPKRTRKPSAYSKRYGREFKRLSPKYKLKKGGWAKDGFKRAQAAAHKATKKAMR